MKPTKFVFNLMAIAAMTLGFASCSSDDDNSGGGRDGALVGTWQLSYTAYIDKTTGETSSSYSNTSSITILELKSDGTGSTTTTYSYGSSGYTNVQTEAFGWSTEGGKVMLNFDYNTSDDDPDIRTYAYEVSDKTLSMEHQSSKTSDTAITKYYYTRK